MPGTSLVRRFARRRSTLVAAGAVVLAVAGGAVAAAVASDAPPASVGLTSAVQQIRSGDVERARLDAAAGEVELTLDGGRHVTSAFPQAYAGDLTAALVAARVPTDVDPDAGVSPWAETVSRVLVPLLLVAGLFLGLRAWNGTGSASRTRRSQVPDTTFDDVAGCPEAVADLAEIADLLVDPDRFAAAGARTPRGYLLTGPPGTGKTLLARAVAGQAKVPFFATSGADFADMYVGTGKRAVRRLFADAREAATKDGGAVVFIDEVDAVGRARSGGRRDSASDERDSTLIALLTEMDGFDGRSGVVVLAATNRPDALDDALTRPRRFDRQVTVAAPDARGRADILAVHTARVPVADDVDLVALGRRTPGLVGADLEALVNEAALEAGRRRLPAADAACFEEALATAALGRARTGAIIPERDRRITAWHEAGHAVLALTEADAQDPVTVTIVPRGVSGGTTWMAGTDDAFVTREQALANLRVSMGGRAGEEILLDGSYSQGASGDLEGATRLGLAMATRYGMTRLGLVSRPLVEGEIPAEVLEVVDELLVTALDEARAALVRHRPLFDALVEQLLEDETVGPEGLAALRERFDAPTADVVPHVPAQRSAAVPAPTP